MLRRAPFGGFIARSDLAPADAFSKGLLGLVVEGSSDFALIGDVGYDRGLPSEPAA